MNNKYKVYITRLLSQEANELLNEVCDYEVYPDPDIVSRQELIEKVKNRDAIICNYADKLDDEILRAAAPSCTIIANCAAGHDNIDIEAAKRQGIHITNTPGANYHTVADMAWGLLFAVTRMIVDADRCLRAGIYKGFEDMTYMGLDVTGRTLGILGAGQIGQVFGEKAKGFDMRILYHDVDRKENFERLTAARFVTMDTLLKESDFISIHVPLRESTRHLISTRELEMMKKTAILINTARGALVDEEALIKALKEGQIWGAGLDVYEWEPQVSPELKEMHNVVLTSHMASCTTETRFRTVKIAVENVLACARGEIPPNCVNL